MDEETTPLIKDGGRRSTRSSTFTKVAIGEPCREGCNFQDWCIFIFLPGIALVLAIAAVVALAVALGFSLSGADSKNNSAVETCMTASCVEAAAFILQNIDPAVDPCNDFYNFTCGRWAMKNIVPAGTQNSHMHIILGHSKFFCFCRWAVNQQYIYSY